MTDEVKKSPDVSLGIRRRDGESWRDAAIRYGKMHGLEEEVEDSYNTYIAAGDPEETAAWAACYDWDVTALFVDGVEKIPQSR